MTCAREHLERTRKTSWAACAKRNMKRDEFAGANWFQNSPRGLDDKVQFLAWKHRRKCPIIRVSAPSTSFDSVVDVVMIPRTTWEKYTKTHECSGMTIAARALTARSEFRTDEMYLVLICIDSYATSAISMKLFNPVMLQLHSSALMLSADVYSVEVMRSKMDLTSTYVRLTGLGGAAHLNGQEGVLKGRDPTSVDRINVGLQNGKVVSVRPQSYEVVHRPKLFNDEF